LAGRGRNAEFRENNYNYYFFKSHGQNSNSVMGKFCVLRLKPQCETICIKERTTNIALKIKIDEKSIAETNLYDKFKSQKINYQINIDQ
jgi:hypothetical protein